MPFDVTLGTTNERTTNALLFLQTECHKNAFTFAQIQIWMHKLCIKVVHNNKIVFKLNIEGIYKV